MNITPLVLQMPDTLNPYTEGLKMLWFRLKWDLSPTAWASRRTLKSLHNSQLGQKAVIVCNGPSLARADFSLLQGIYTFGMNKINLLFDSNPFRPSCICAIDELIVSQNRDFFNTSELPLFITHKGAGLLAKRGNVTFLHESKMKFFARDVSMSLYTGYTVTFVALQLAFHMGFQKTALIGCDHSFEIKAPPGQRFRSEDGHDSNHFIPNYYSKGDLINPPNYKEMDYAYQLAYEVFTASGRELYNCTDGGKLEFFPRMALHDFVMG